VDLSRRIRHLRYGKGWGTDELAAHANISRTALIQIENGRTRNPQAGTLRKLSRALGVPLERLLETEPDAVDDAAVPRGSGLPTTTASTVVPGRFPSSERAEDLMEKLRVILRSTLAEGVARIVEDSFRLLQNRPPPISIERSRYASSIAPEASSSTRGRETPSS
jgi:transcriptional regulator with XRE-family HTH domain